jgi:hypothetical protein
VSVDGGSAKLQFALPQYFSAWSQPMVRPGLAVYYGHDGMAGLIRDGQPLPVSSVYDFPAA